MIYLLFATFAAFSLISVWLAPLLELRAIQQIDPHVLQDPLEASKHKNELRKTAATIAGGVAVFASLMAAIFQWDAGEKQRDDSRFEAALRLLGSDTEPLRIAGVHELMQVGVYASSRQETAKGVLTAFVRGEVVAAQRVRREQLRTALVAAVSLIDDEGTRQDALHRLETPEYAGGEEITTQMVDKLLGPTFRAGHSNSRLELAKAILFRPGIVLGNDVLSAIRAVGIVTDVSRYGSEPLQQVKIDHSNFRSASMSIWDLSGSTFRSCNLAGCSFTGTVLEGASFQNCNLADADFRGAALAEARFIHCDLKRVKFDPGGLDGVAELHMESLDDLDALSDAALQNYRVQEIEGRRYLSGPDDQESLRQESELPQETGDR